MIRLTSKEVHRCIHQRRFYLIHTVFFSGVFLVVIVLLLFVFLVTLEGMSCSVSVLCVPKEVTFQGKNSWRTNETDAERQSHGAACGFPDPFSLPQCCPL